MIKPAESDSDNLGGELITEEDLAGAVGEDMGSDDPVVRRLWDDLIRGEHAKAILAEAETRRVIEFNRSLDHRFQEGLGQLVARIPLSVYLHWTAIHGHEFWDDPDSLQFLAKRAGGGQGNPGLLIETKGRPTVVKTADFPSGHKPAGCNGESSAAGSDVPAATASFANPPSPSLRRTGPTEARAPYFARNGRGERGRWALATGSRRAA